MPEQPDFDRIAAQVCKELDDPWGHPIALDVMESLRRSIVEQLRLAWNARGAADIALLDTELSAMMGGIAAGPYVKNLDRAMRKLDR